MTFLTGYYCDTLDCFRGHLKFGGIFSDLFLLVTIVILWIAFADTLNLVVYLVTFFYCLLLSYFGLLSRTP